MSTAVFTKSRADVHPDFFPAEAAGLRWLGDAGAPVVDVLEVDSAHIELSKVQPGRATESAAFELGAALARMHDAGVDDARFGCPPAGFDGQIFIGNRSMTSTQHARWGEFYAEERVLPYVRAAVDAGTVDAGQRRDVERACERITDGVFDDDDAPARIHGDLWSGNVLWSDHGAVLIDPAAHGGHRETDLAMLDLFGCPHLASVLDGYRSAHPLRDGWRSRVPLHQLHPLAVHAAGHGASYGFALHDAAVQTLRLAA